jgi:general secretion pathway protein G
MLLATNRTTRQRAARRAAFTLLEVLIVVAILVILAGSASIALFKYLDDAKKGRAKADMMAIEKSIKKIYMENGGQNWPDVSQSAAVASNLEQGSAALMSPWNTPYTWTIIGANTDGSATERPLISCQTSKGETISWPER